MFNDLWAAVHGNEEPPYWGLDLDELQTKIGNFEDKERQELLQFLFRSVLHFARCPTPEASPYYEPSRRVLWEIVEGIPDLLDAVRAERSLPPTNFTLDKDQAEENLKNELNAIIQPPPLDKSAKGRPAGRDTSKKQKSPEEAKAMLEEARQEGLIRVTKHFESRVVDGLDAGGLEHGQVQARQEQTLFGDLIDRLNRKKRTENTALITGRYAASVSLHLKPRLPNPTQTDLTADDFTEQSLNDLKTTLTELSLLYPKFIFVLLKIYDGQGKLVRLPAKTISDYLTKETELKIVQEPGPFIPDYEDKMENNFYEDGTFVVVGNSLSHEAFRTHSLSPANVRFSKMWSEVWSAASQLSVQTNAYIDTDVQGLFEYDPFVSALKVDEVIFGGKIKTALDLIKGFFTFEKVLRPRMLILGGLLTPEKVWMAINSITYFSKVVLVGTLGLLWTSWILDPATPLLSDAQRKLFEHFDLIAKQMDKKITSLDEFVCLKVAEGEMSQGTEEHKVPPNVFDYHDEARSADLFDLKLAPGVILESTSDGSFVYRPASEGEEPPSAYRLLDYHPKLSQAFARQIAGFENTLV